MAILNDRYTHLLINFIQPWNMAHLVPCFFTTGTVSMKRKLALRCENHPKQGHNWILGVMLHITYNIYTYLHIYMIYSTYVHICT
jgi:hypothetical protein